MRQTENYVFKSILEVQRNFFAIDAKNLLPVARSLKRNKRIQVNQYTGHFLSLKETVQRHTEEFLVVCFPGKEGYMCVPRAKIGQRSLSTTVISNH